MVKSEGISKTSGSVDVDYQSSNIAGKIRSLSLRKNVFYDLLLSVHSNISWPSSLKKLVKPAFDHQWLSNILTSESLLYFSLLIQEAQFWGML